MLLYPPKSAPCEIVKSVVLGVETSVITVSLPLYVIVI
jgi:hypothetical protein